MLHTETKTTRDWTPNLKSATLFLCPAYSCQVRSTCWEFTNATTANFNRLNITTLGKFDNTNARLLLYYIYNREEWEVLRTVRKRFPDEYLRL